jgi:hypothetical protein
MLCIEQGGNRRRDAVDAKSGRAQTERENKLNDQRV